MKSAFLATFGLIASVAAQWPDLPDCEKTCRDNMVGSAKSAELGCNAGDLACLCTKRDFIYGLRDCSSAICNSDQAADLLQAGLKVCKDAGVEITTGGSQSTEVEVSGIATLSTIYSTLTADGSAITTAVGTTGVGVSGGSGQVIIETITQSDGDVVRSTITTVGVTKATGSSDASETENATDTDSDASNTSTDENETATDATGTQTSAGSQTTTTSSGNAGVPQMTAHPVGMLAAAGLAVLIL